MNKNHYDVLGVARTATADEIKLAYRKLAAKHHPDRGGDTSKFQEIQTAYDVLSDQSKRSQYDNPHQFQQEFGGFPGGGFSFNFNDVFSQMFNQHQHARRNHVRMTLWIHLEDVAQGTSKTINVSTHDGNTTVNVGIPLGIEDGDNVQYSGVGPNGVDLVVQFRIHPHRYWQRNGLNLSVEQRVSVWDLVLGGELEITDMENNRVKIQIPTNTQPGTTLRVRSHGLKDRHGARGDILVRLLAQIPNRIAPEIIDAIRKHR